MESQWKNRRVAFLGDSITDKIHVGTAKNYWQFLEEYLGIVPLVYGINGCSWRGILPQAEALYKEHASSVDAIIIMMGTNDYNSSFELGKWWELRPETVNSHGKMLTKMRRFCNMDETTFRGTINRGMSYIKTHFPHQQILLLTPVHRGYANFGGTNVQPEESFPNDINLYLEEYVNVLKEAGSIWSVPVIDLHGISGLLPANDSYAQYFHDERTDRLHPNAAGHERIAKTLLYQMLALPASF